MSTVDGVIALGLAVVAAGVLATAVAVPVKGQIDQFSRALITEAPRREPLSFMERRSIEIQCFREVGDLLDPGAWGSAIDVCRARSLREARE